VSDAIRVFVNAAALDLPAGSTVTEAIQATDQALLDKIASGAALVTDGRGIEIDCSAPLASGAILRIVIRARGRSGDADA
jgi:hypothetical protein